MQPENCEEKIMKTHVIAYCLHDKTILMYEKKEMS